MPSKSGKYAKIVHYFISHIGGCLENILIEFYADFIILILLFVVNVAEYEFLKTIFILKCYVCSCLKQLIGKKTLRSL